MNRKERVGLMWRIAERAERMGLVKRDISLLITDLEYAYEEFNLKLEDLLDSEDFYFSCEILAIQKNIDSHSGDFEEGFIPLFAGK